MNTQTAFAEAFDAEPNQPYTWSIDIRADGLATLDSLTITDTLPYGWTYVPGSAEIVDGTWFLSHDNEGTFDDDAGIDMDAVAAFFRGGTRVTPELVKQFERTYRDGQPERDDLLDYFRRFDGDVRLADQYIPYSDESDFVRFVAFWDARIDDGELQPGPQWKAARKALLRKGKGRRVSEAQ